MLEFLPESCSGSDVDDQAVLVCESADSEILSIVEQDGVKINNIENFEKTFLESILVDNFDKALKGLKFRF